MSRDQLVRLLLRVSIVFVGLQIAVVVLALAVLASVALGDGMPTTGLPR